MGQLVNEVVRIAGTHWQGHVQVELEYLAAHPEELLGYLEEREKDPRLTLAAWIVERARARPDPDRFDVRLWEPDWLDGLTSSGEPPLSAPSNERCGRPSRRARSELEVIVPEMFEATLALRDHGPRVEAEWFLRTLTRRSAPPELYSMARRLVPWVRDVARLSDEAFKPARRKMAASRMRTQRIGAAAPEYALLLDAWFPKKSHTRAERVALDDPVMARIRRLTEIARITGPPPRRQDGRAAKREVGALMFRLLRYWGPQRIERLEAANPRLGDFPLVDTLADIARHTELSPRLVLDHIRDVEKVLTRVHAGWLTLMGMPPGAEPPSVVLQTT